jgi:hypothetical protein
MITDSLQLRNKMITINDIINRLNLTRTQVDMAIYSGYLPKPTINDNAWEDNHINWFISNWEAKLNRTKKRDY